MIKNFLKSIPFFKKLIQEFNSLNKKVIFLENQVTQLRAIQENLFFKLVPKESYGFYIKKWYLDFTGEPLNIESPVSFNEKIQWMKLYGNISLKTKLTDKYLVREWVKEKIGDEFLIPLLGVWESAYFIEWEKLPREFILKTNHGSGWNHLVEDKESINKREVSDLFNFWLSLNFGYKYGLETQYQNISPKIIAEEIIKPSGSLGLKDFKVHCFEGKVKFIAVYYYDENSVRVKEIYNIDWTLTSFYIIRESAETAFKSRVEKPENLELMLQLAEKLSQDFSYVRIDFYNENNKIYFGEMTFTPGNGLYSLEPKEWEKNLGDWIDLGSSRYN